MARLTLNVTATSSLPHYGAVKIVVGLDLVADAVQARQKVELRGGENHNRTRLPRSDSSDQLHRRISSSDTLSVEMEMHTLQVCIPQVQIVPMLHVLMNHQLVITAAETLKSPRQCCCCCCYYCF
ncbi:unnamed protein product [Protopolystoma xenopodis]|uniref:Uncharacterized protein n=1 Tax=Protopolystoma xenopodis TaxID=117903 RepID=A0A448XJT3_9PLAT|nr:unnamed protein product [Protopolystoma xenopodis]